LVAEGAAFEIGLAKFAEVEVGGEGQEAEREDGDDVGGFGEHG
jgi:hypothetical protein